jgi:hypothetical protein
LLFDTLGLISQLLGVFMTVFSRPTGWIFTT